MAKFLIEANYTAEGAKGLVKVRIPAKLTAESDDVDR